MSPCSSCSCGWPLPDALELQLQVLQLTARDDDLVRRIRRAAIEHPIDPKQQGADDEEVQQGLTEESLHRPNIKGGPEGRNGTLVH